MACARARKSHATCTTRAWRRSRAFGEAGTMSIGGADFWGTGRFNPKYLELMRS
ncbi:hypothetical protein AJ78_08562, partial [Emergomyces pasteurianus Ep9510]